MGLIEEKLREECSDKETEDICAFFDSIMTDYDTSCKITNKKLCIRNTLQKYLFMGNYRGNVFYIPINTSFSVVVKRSMKYNFADLLR